jgi:hypothetical protein
LSADAGGRWLRCPGEWSAAENARRLALHWPSKAEFAPVVVENQRIDRADVQPYRGRPRLAAACHWPSRVVPTTPLDTVAAWLRSRTLAIRWVGAENARRPAPNRPCPGGFAPVVVQFQRIQCAHRSRSVPEDEVDAGHTRPTPTSSPVPGQDRRAASGRCGRQRHQQRDGRHVEGATQVDQPVLNGIDRDEDHDFEGDQQRQQLGC